MAKREPDDADERIQDSSARPRRPASRGEPSRGEPSRREPSRGEPPRREPARGQDEPPRPRRRPPEDDDEDYDDEDDRPRRPRRRGDNAVSTIIPYHNGMALTAYYLGVFSLIPGLGLLLGPAALIFGIVGLRRVRANPEVKGTGHAVTGLVLGSLTTLANWAIVAIFVIGILSRR